MLETRFFVPEGASDAASVSASGSQLGWRQTVQLPPVHTANACAQSNAGHGVPLHASLRILAAAR